MSLKNKEFINNEQKGEKETSSLFFYGNGEMERKDAPQEFVVTEELSGHRLDFVLSRIIGISRGFAGKIIKSGEVEIIPQRRVKPALLMRAGDVIKVTIPEPETLDLEPEDVDFEVLYSDCDVIVINKPAGLVVHPAPGHWRGTLVHGLLFRFPDLGVLNGVKRPGIVHRLDATTSGLMVVARNGLAMEGLFRDFKERHVRKEYIALCYGSPRRDSGSISLPIGRDPNNRIRMTVIDDGREARTDYNLIWSRGDFSLIICVLHSGRTHQIRVHMKAIGCPLVGDALYAPSKKSPFESGRVFLHSWKLGFTHPRTREKMFFRAPLPGELTNFLRELLSKNQDRRI